MLEDRYSSLRTLLADAVPADVFAAGRGTEKPCKPSTSEPIEGPGTAGEAPSGSLSISDGVAVITFLIEKEALDLGSYPEWINVAIAFKNSFGDAGFAPWLALSEAANGFEGEDECRKHWNGIKERSGDEKPLTIATYIAMAQKLGWKTVRRSRRKAGSGGKSDDVEKVAGPGRGEDLAAFTVNLVQEAGDEFWLDQEAKPHVTYKAETADGVEVKRHLPVLGSAYRAILQGRFFDATDSSKTLKDDQATSAAAILAMRARRSGVRHHASLRVAQLEDRIFVDLGTPDGTAVEIDSEGWRVVPEPPVHFVRGNRGELPVPTDGGTLASFKPHFNLSEDDLQRAVGFMIGVFNVSGSYAILMTDGEQGSCKSTLNDKVLGLTDPPHQTKSARMSFNPKEQDLHIQAQGAHVLSFDNVSTFSADAADMLCRIATGGASGSRELYSNDRFNQFVVIRPVILTCIGVPSSRADLLDRSVRITAQPVARRLTERVVQAAFERDQPALLGFLFSCVSAALKNRASVNEAIEAGTLQLPRMADFAAFVEGAHEMLGLPSGGFSALLQAGQKAMQIEAVTGDPVGAGLVRYFSRPTATSLNATASELLRMLREQAQDQEGGVRWPAANAFNKRLKRFAVGLRHLGIEFQIFDAGGHDNVAKYKIWATPAFQPQGDDGADEPDFGGGHF